MTFRLTEKQLDKLLRGDAVKSGSKFFNQQTVVRGISFQSKFEAKHYQELVYRERVGEIRRLRRQVVFPLVVQDVEICRYIADFVYEERDVLQATLPGLDGTQWIERRVDTKSETTRRLPDYRIKFKLMAALGTPITEVIAPRTRRKRPRQRRRC